MTDRISKIPVGTDPFLKYEEELKILGTSIDTMHWEINERHKKYDKLRLEKEGLKLEHLKLKEESNNLQF